MCGGATFVPETSSEGWFSFSKNIRKNLCQLAPIEKIPDVSDYLCLPSHIARERLKPLIDPLTSPTFALNVKGTELIRFGRRDDGIFVIE